MELFHNGNQNAFPSVAVTSNAPPNTGVAAWNSYNGSNLIIQAVNGAGISFTAAFKI